MYVFELVAVSAWLILESSFLTSDVAKIVAKCTHLGERTISNGKFTLVQKLSKKFRAY